MNGNACSLVCIFVLVVLPCITLALGGGRFVDWNDERDAEEMSRNRRQFLGRNRGVRALDMLDAPSFGGSRTFGGFGYNSQNSDKRAHQSAEY